ncbi:MAG: RsmE family RNA methyltransferase, partial [Alphaproteobacteria bacterium]|nr:RsmE family RNA methyltransferase [Alphaproteobacteria bacterium]
LERLEANAIEAAEQCECLSIPEIGEETALSKLLQDWPEERRLIFCDEQGGPPALEAFAALKAELGASAQETRWAVLIGPEGGFSEKERELIRRVPNSIPISLGPRILRADTAAVASLSLFQASLGDW